MKKITFLSMLVVALAGCKSDVNGDDQQNKNNLGKILNSEEREAYSIISTKSLDLTLPGGLAEWEFPSGELRITEMGVIDEESNQLIAKNYRQNNIRNDINKISPQIHVDPYNNICSQVAINTLYTVTPQSGLSVCLYFDIPIDSRTDFFTLNQTGSRQTNTRIAHDVLANASLTLAGVASTSGSEDHVLAYTEAGHYYMLIDSVSTDGGAIQFGAAVNTNVDQYEDIGGIISYVGNDNPNHPYPITNDFDFYFANLDNPNDIDNYLVTSDNGQDIILSLFDGESPGLWRLEVWNNSIGWFELSTNLSLSLGVASAGQQILFRVRYADGVTPDRTKAYRINTGSRIANIDNLTPGSTESIVRMPFGSTNPYYTTQVHTNFEWKAKIEDSEGQPISNVLVAMVYATENIPASVDSDISDQNGIVSKTITLPVCDENESIHIQEHVYNEPGNNVNQVWQTKYDAGAWYMLVPEARGEDEIGVGSPNGSQVSLAHICKQRLITIDDYTPCEVASCQ